MMLYWRSVFDRRLVLIKVFSVPATVGLGSNRFSFASNVALICVQFAVPTFARS